MPVSLMKYEIYKMFHRKSLIIVIIISIVLQIVLMIFTGKQRNEMDENYYRTYINIVTGHVTNEKLLWLKNEKQILDDTIDKYDFHYQQYIEKTITTKEYKKYLAKYNEALQKKNSFLEAYEYYIRIMNWDNNLKSLRRSLDSFEHAKDMDNPEYIKKKAVYERLINVKAPEVIYSTGWEDLLVIPLYEIILISIIIIIGISPLWSEEYSSGMMKIIASSKQGRKVTSIIKLMLASIYSIFIVVLFIIIKIVYFTYKYDWMNWNSAIQSIDYFQNSILNISNLQYLIISSLFRIIAYTALGLMTLLISLLAKSTVFTIFISWCIFSSPILLVEMSKGIVGSVLDFSLFSIIEFEKLFEQSRIYVLGGQPLLSSFIILPVLFICIFILVFVIFFYNRSSKNKLC
ncbi:MAG: hypothetical protein FIA99_18120 [Ruminiclostridium sp.]|nr:hypothetical protein [Ruminiclostridium sp.]